MTINDYRPRIEFNIDTSPEAPENSRYITMFASFNQRLHKSITVKCSGSVKYSGTKMNGEYYSGNEGVRVISYTCAAGNSNFKNYVGNLPMKNTFNLSSADFSGITYSLFW